MKTYEDCLDKVAQDLDWDNFDDAVRNHLQLRTLIDIMTIAAELWKNT